jgi:8-oxo-dGTP pyrophosphatase MutT (NUDIX family)
MVLLHVGARCVVRDDEGRILLIRRSDNGVWAMPAGGLDLGDSIAECAAREVFEESGLIVDELTPFAMYTGGLYTSTNVYGHTYQLHITAFRIDAWHGDLVKETDETTDAGWFHIDEFPTNTGRSVRLSLADLAEFEATGRFMLR